MRDEIEAYNRQLEKWKQLFYSKLEKNKKCVVMFSMFATYTSLFGNLHQRFRELGWCVINLKSPHCKDETLDKKAITLEIPLFQNEYFLESLNLDGIDLIISTNITSKDLISKNATGIYLSHDAFTGVVPESGYKYLFFATESSIATMINDKNNYDCTNRCFIKGGYLKLDSTIESYESIKKNSKEKHSILIAPTVKSPQTATEENLAYNVGFDQHLIEFLLEQTSYSMVYRAHPTSLNHPSYDILTTKFQNNQRVEFSQRPLLEDYARSLCMITDISTTAFTYSLTTLKPSIFFAPGIKAFDVQKRPVDVLGFHVKKTNDILNVIDTFQSKQTAYTSKIEKYKSETIFNIGRSEDYLLENLEYILTDSKHPNWIYT